MAYVSVAMMRLLCVLCCFGAMPCFANAQSSKETKVSTTKEQRRLLETELDTSGFEKELVLDEFTRTINERLMKAGKREVRFEILAEQFDIHLPDYEVSQKKIRLKGLPSILSVRRILDRGMANLTNESGTPLLGYLIREGKVEIVPRAMTSREETYNRKVTATYELRRFQEAIDELADLSGVSIVVDPK